MKLPNQHLTAQEAVLIIQKIFSSAGCLSEIVVNDYGEDLRLQPSNFGDADPFSIGVQVKGINKNTKKSKKYVDLKIEHLRRWHDSISPMILCVHDFHEGKSYITTAKRFKSRWEYLQGSQLYKRIRLSDFEELTPKRALAEVWHCRFTYYNYSMYIILGDLSEWKAFQGIGDFGKYDIDPETPADIHLFATEILSSLGIFNTDGDTAFIDEFFLKTIDQTIRENHTKHPYDLYQGRVIN